ncbi:MAG: hypothetical protein ABIH42_05365, partial [Planctomycetota bacterium]
SRIGYLLDQIRLNGEKAELKTEVVKLAKEFGILTPYTSYLVVEDNARVAPASRMRNDVLEEAGRLSKSARMAPLSSESKSAGVGGGRSSVEKSEEFEAMKSLADSDKKKDQSGKYSDGFVAKELKHMIKQVGEKTFYSTNGVWCDQEYNKEMKTTKVKYMSDEYFELIAKSPKLAKFLSIGEKIIVVFEGTAYEITTD